MTAQIYLGDNCGRCAVRSEYAQYESKNAARRAGVIGDTRNHAESDCIKHLVRVIEYMMEGAQ